MANDDPTNLRMGFGYEQARVAGLTGFQNAPTASEMNWHLEWEAATKVLRHIVHNHPEMGDLVRKIIAAQRAANSYSAPDVLRALWRMGCYCRPMRVRNQP
jgi:hypothetical protein